MARGNLVERYAPIVALLGDECVRPADLTIESAPTTRFATRIPSLKLEVTELRPEPP